MGLKYLYSDFVKLIKKLDIEIEEESQNFSFDIHQEILNLVNIFEKKFLEKSN